MTESISDRLLNRLVPALVLAMILALVALLALPARAALAQDRILVFAAASMSDALDRIAADFEAQTGVKAVLSLAGTGVLARQIEAGAPADIFISADREWMDYAAERGVVRAGSITVIAENSLVLAGAHTSDPVELTVAGLDEALGTGRLAIADTETVPAGRYGKASLEALGVWTDLQSRLAPMENVRIALAAAARGDTPLALVYLSDAQAEPDVHVLADIPEDLHPKIEYPAALTVNAGQKAELFLTYLTEPAAQKIFGEAGFRPVRN